MTLSVKVYKDLGSFQLDVEFEASGGQIALLGPSGCGKSLTLGGIAGRVRPDRGHIELNGRVLFDSERGLCLPPQERRTGLLFQNYALFPTMTLLENLCAGARRCCPDEALRRKRALSAAERFGLAGLIHHFPRQLSSGKKQRPAMARMLLAQP